jgi:Amj-like protein
MDVQLAVICGLTFGIQLIGALAYSARIAGVRTGRIAMSFALFNVLVLLSRLSNGFLGPFLANRIEDALAHGTGGHLLGDFRLVLASATAATIVGTMMVPTVQRWFSAAIGQFQEHRSIARLLLHAFARGGIGYLRQTATPPKVAHLKDLARPRGVSLRVIIFNVVAQGLLVVGVVASLYAGYLYPEYRVTASQLSAVVNGLATLMLFILIDPQLSVMTDDVISGQVSEPVFRRTIVWLSVSRVAGTVLAQALFLPAAWLVVAAARAF